MGGRGSQAVDDVRRRVIVEAVKDISVGRLVIDSFHLRIGHERRFVEDREFLLLADDTEVRHHQVLSAVGTALELDIAAIHDVQGRIGVWRYHCHDHVGAAAGRDLDYAFGDPELGSCMVAKGGGLGEHVTRAGNVVRYNRDRDVVCDFVRSDAVAIIGDGQGMRLVETSRCVVEADTAGRNMNCFRDGVID